MIEWIPAYETLFETEKRGMLLSARCVLIGLSLFARKEQRDGVVRLPLGIQDPAEGIRDLLGGSMEEARNALAQLTDPEDPAIEVGGKPGRLTVRVLSSATWALGKPESGQGGSQGATSGAGQTVTDPRERRRLADAERKRRVRAEAKKGADMSAPDSGRRADAPADTGADSMRTRPQTECGQRADIGGEGGDVSDLQTQNRKEEIRAEESRSAHTSAPSDDRGHRADTDADRRADASAPDSGRGRPRTADRLLAILRASEDIAPMEQAGLLDLVRCVRDVVDEGANYVIGGKLREDEIDERLDAAVRDVVRAAASAASTLQPLPALAVSTKLRTFAASTLGKSREEWARRSKPSDRGAAVPNTEARQVLDLFAKLWSKAKRAPFVASEGDEKASESLVTLARPHVTGPGDGSAIVKHWTERYLDDVDTFVTKPNHPLRLLPTRVGQYGLPKPKNAAPAAPTAPEPPPPSAEEAARLALEHRAKIASIGTGGATMPVARPS